MTTDGTSRRSNFVALLGRARCVGILGSRRLSVAATAVQEVLKARGCSVVAALEGQAEAAAEVLPESPLDAVLIIGGSPEDPEAFAPGSSLEAPARAIFAALAQRAPLHTLDGSCEEVKDFAQKIAEMPMETKGSAEERWMQVAKAAAQDDAAALVDFLSRCPELRTAQGSGGQSLLHVAAKEGAKETTAILLERGCDVAAQDAEEATAGDLAFEAGHQAVFEILVQHRLQQFLEERQKEEHEESLPSATKRQRRNEEPPSPREVHDDYMHQKLEYQDGRLLDENRKGIMMGWEAPLMEKHAESLLVGEGAKVANVGFGLGLVDGFLQKQRPSSHAIVEAHPDVLKEMESRGWTEKPGVVVHRGRWQDVVPSWPAASLDAVFFDTWCETYDDVRAFMSHLPRILRPGGRFSFFNGLAPYSLLDHAAFCRLAQDDLLELGLECDFQALHLGSLADEVWEGVAERYWQFGAYYLPVATLTAKGVDPHERPDAQSCSGGGCWRRRGTFPVRVDDKIGPRLPRSVFKL
eukprot:TRINITY_DN32117_c0_g1_i1.p1 TRINITY_DN32117_c0_g1~~TRINITY_DN32117_c0_g1_i1.p1  ORF type:complete len:539 (-),score=133.91 TRINITY_DN32117_c0_g1_i1:57-1628(-)